MRLSACGGGCGRENVSTVRQSSPGWGIMSRMMTWGVVLTGAPGAGKSSVLERLVTLLEIEGVAFGALESEQLGWGSPWLSGEPWLGQLRAVLELQRQAGRRRFLIAATTETSDELAAVGDAIAVDRLVFVLLTVAPEVAAARIVAREPDMWPGKQDLIERARHLAVSMRGLAGIDIRIDTDAREAGDVAVELREALRPHGLR
jgi:chloramphenicol 3-O-phosphotransferase